MSVTTEQLHAYLDGELDAVEVARIEKALAADPALAQALEVQRRLRDRLRAAFAPVLEEPVPKRLLEAAGASPRQADTTVVNLATRRVRRHWAPGIGLAAAMALGIMLGPRLMKDQSLVIDGEGGQRLAQGDLDRALTTALGSESVGLASVGISFRDGNGRLCRSFVLRQERAMAGLSCRNGDAWQIELLVEAESSESELRMASSGLPMAVLDAIDARIDGEPLDAAGEAQAIEKGWR